MRLLLAILASSFTLVAGPAAACLPHAPPYWPDLMRTDGPPVMVGRVASVTPNAESRDYPGFEIEEATALIDAVDWLQGEGPEQIEYVAATAVRAVPGRRTYGWCGEYMTLEPGELVLVVVSPHVAQVFEPSALPAEWRARVESYQ